MRANELHTFGRCREAIIKCKQRGSGGGALKAPDDELWQVVIIDVVDASGVVVDDDGINGQLIDRSVCVVNL